MRGCMRQSRGEKDVFECDTGERKWSNLSANFFLLAFYNLRIMF